MMSESYEMTIEGSPLHGERLSWHNINDLWFALRDGNSNFIQNFGDDALEQLCIKFDLEKNSNQTLLHRLCISEKCNEETRVEIAEWIYTRSLQGGTVAQNFHLQNLNRPDVEKRTPLHYAAKFERSMLLLWFIEKNLLQTIFEEDADQLTPFQYLIMSPREEMVPIAKTIWTAVGNPSITFNIPPLHLAAKIGSVQMINLLIDVCGCSPNKYDDDGKAALHIAIQHSDESERNTYSRILYLLKKTSPENYYTTAEKNSPIHVAAQFGKFQILEFLFNVYKDSGTGQLSVINGEYRISAQAHFNKQSNGIWKNLLLPLSSSRLNLNGQTCLHVVPNQNASHGSVECVKLILNHPDLMKENERDRETFCMRRDNKGQTVLHIAAEFEMVEICQEILKRMRLDPNSEWLRHAFLKPIYKKIPDALLPVFENCVHRINGFSRKEELEIMDFRPIVGERLHLENGQRIMTKPETYFLQKVNSLNPKIKSKIFKNPLVQKFITEKIKRLRGLSIAVFTFHIVHICMFILLAYTVTDCPVDNNTSTNTSELVKDGLSPRRLFWLKCDSHEYWQFGSTIAVLALTFAILFTAKESYQFFTNKKKHFNKKSNIFQLLFNVLTFLWIIALVVSVEIPCAIPYIFLRMLTATIVLLGAALSFYQLKKLNIAPTFVGLFLHAATKSTQLLAYYILLIITFMVVFKTLSLHSDGYQGLRGIVKVLVMMMGEFEFDSNFKLSSDDSFYRLFLTIAELLAFALFIFISTVVGLNLLLALTVQGIQTLKKEAEWEILSFQLDQLFMMEELIFYWKKFIPRKLFLWILDRISVVNSKTVEPNGYYSTKLTFPVEDNS